MNRTLAIGLAASTVVAAAAVPARARERPTRRNHASARLHALLEEQWNWWMQDAPTWASTLGDHRWDDRWRDLSLEAQAARERRMQEVLEKLDRIDRRRLPEADRVNFDLFRRRIQDDMAEHELRTWLMPLNQRGGVQTAHELAETLRLETLADFESWLARMRGLDRHVAETTQLLRLGLGEGMVQPRIIMERVPDQIALQVVASPEQSPFYRAFRELPPGIPPEQSARIRDEALQVIEGTIVPAYRELHRFFVEEYLPGCREEVGAVALPRGRELYEHRVRKYTTTTLSPREVHDLGVAEVARIRSEMEGVIDEVGFRGSFQEFLTFLRTDRRFHLDDEQALLERYRAECKRIDPELVRLFRRLPRMPYGVRPIPPEAAPDTTTAYYTWPAGDGSRAGIYWVNLYQPETRYLWEIPALTLHEAVPGHHLQIALAQELEELPAFRRYEGYTAFVEGWGLYAERLGYEMDVYDDAYERFGQLTYEMWRAVRLVVDTGLHQFGWSRQRAIDYFAANAPRSGHDIVNEIDRYIAWPGQALAYKIGELRIRALRARATEALGDAFDVREFHEVVLGQGAVPLDTLEAHVDRWVESKAPANGR